MIDFTEMHVGDFVTMMMPPPPTWWERALWRLFRIEWKREPVEQTFVVQGVTSGTDDDPAPSEG